LEKNGTLADLDETPEHFKERVGISYKKALHEKRMTGRDGDVGHYGCRSANGFPTLGIHKEDFDLRRQEAQNEWKNFCREQVQQAVNIDVDIRIFSNSK